MSMCSNVNFISPGLGVSARGPLKGKERHSMKHGLFLKLFLFCTAWPTKPADQCKLLHTSKVPNQEWRILFCVYASMCDCVCMCPCGMTVCVRLPVYL